MFEKDCLAIGVFGNHQDAEEAIKELQHAGFDMKKLSIVGTDYQTEENVVGYYNIGERAVTWGKLGLFWGAVWGLLLGSAFFVLPGIGPVIVGGPLVNLIVVTLETAAIVGGISAVGGALSSIGVPKDSVLRYELALKADKLILILHGNTKEAEDAKHILEHSKAEETSIHIGIIAVDSKTGEPA